MYFFSKTAWVLLQPGHLLLLGLVAGWVMTLCRGTRRIGMWLGGLVTLALVLLALLPVGDWLLRPLENRFAGPATLERVDGILVMGGGQDPVVSQDRDRIALNDSGERMIESAAIALRFPGAKLVFSGGNGASGLTEADVAQRVYDAMGIDPRTVLYDDRARTTWESAIFLRALVAPKPGEVWLLVTSAFHMPRSVAVFRTAGWDVVPYPVDFRVTKEGGGLLRSDLDGNLRTLDVAFHEYLGLLAYRLTGRTDELFPAP